MRALVLDWNGQDVPLEFTKLPPGRYVVEPVVTPEEAGVPVEDVAAVAEALRNLDLAPGSPAVEAAERLRRRIAERAPR
ncbi:MAG: hypothetical protein HY909_16240 [Deltaproteobacteria bacterium]|nr:hypothetical protein [Deltaproteobacteria bacterium]